MSSPSSSAAARSGGANSSGGGGRKVTLAVLLALGVWFLYRYFTNSGSHSSGRDIKSRDAPKVGEPEDKLETTLSNKEADTLRKAAEKYSSEYQELMKTMVAPKEEEHAKPFIGFSLADNIKEGALVVDGVFDAGPASQVGINIDHELVAVAGERPATFDDVRRLIGKHCKPGHITSFSMLNEHGEPYEAELWVMTGEDRFKGKPYFFDPYAHEIRQSDRVKNAYKPRTMQ